MFFPSYSEIITKRFSRKKNTKTLDGSEITETYSYMSLEDRIRKTYGDGKMIDIKPGSKCTESKTIKIVKGEKLKCGFRQFLSNNGKTTHLVRFKKGVPQDEHVDFDSLSGKYLLICCFNAPMLSNDYVATKCRAIIDAYDELSERGYPFEMVVVPNLRTDVDYNQKAAFDHFYSAFSCLAIPFSDFGTRDYIHSCMTRSSNRRWEQGYWAILVDPEGIILQDGQALYSFFNHGSEWTPFLPTTLDAIEKQDEVLRLKFDPMYSPLIQVTLNEADRQQPLSLYKDILLCDPCLTLRRFDAAETDADVFSTVVDLSRKYVGLYMCHDGEIIEDIKAAHDHCLANNQQLEIVLVPMPFYDEPESYNKDLHQVLRLLNIKSWFIFDYNSKSCRRLWRIFGERIRGPMDNFIIIPPNSESGELYGREVIINFGVNQYPFTRTAILKQRLEYLRSLTPVFSSVFNNCLMIQNNQEFKSEQLQGKNVLLYITWSQCDYYSLVKKHYPEIKAMGWEVVFVLLDDTVRYWNRKCVDPNHDCSYSCPSLNLKEIPWPFMLLSTAAKASIKEKLFFPDDCRQSVYLFAVAKDGNIVSRDVHQRLDTDGVTESLFDDVLETDLAYGLADVPLLDDNY